MVQMSNKINEKRLKNENKFVLQDFSPFLLFHQSSHDHPCLFCDPLEKAPPTVSGHIPFMYFRYF